MNLRLVRAALRNYLRPTLVRENPLAMSSAIFSLLVALRFPAERRFVQLHGLAAMFHHGLSPFVMAWWMVALFAPSCVTRHYWRQVTTEISMAAPGLIEAEHGAIATVLFFVGLVLATPLLPLGGPIIGSLAVATLPMIGGLSSPRATGQSRRRRLLLVLLLLPLSLLFLIPSSMAWLLFAPLWVTLPVLLATSAVTGARLRYLPARARLDVESSEQRQDFRAGQNTGTSPRGALAALWKLMCWQPRRWRDDPLPRTLMTPFGPGGWILYSALIMGFMIGTGVLAREFHEPLRRAMHRSVVMAIAESPMFAIFATGKWLSSRGDWPFLYLAGRNGTRSGFTRTLFHAHRRTGIQLAGSVALVIFLALIAFMHVALSDALDASVSAAGLAFGLSYAVAAPLLWNEIGGKGLTVALNGVAAMSATMIFVTGFASRGLQTWLLPVSVAIAAAALALEPVFARRLAQMDWTFEPDPMVS